MKKDILRLKDVAAGYDGIPLYSGVSLSVGEGELVTLLGENGAGKSTLLRVVTGQDSPLSGSVEIAGNLLSEIPAARRGRYVSIVSTERTMAGGLTVAEVVALGRQPYTGFFGRLSADDRLIVADSLLMVGMAGYSDRSLASLSDGERQKVMIARAVAQQTPLMVLDEPTAFLDVASRLEIMRLLASLAREKGMGVLLSSHDVSTAMRLSDRLWLMSRNSEAVAGEADSRRIVEGGAADLVANGAMDLLFPDRDVEFDSALLDFVPKN